MYVCACNSGYVVDALGEPCMRMYEKAYRYMYANTYPPVGVCACEHARWQTASSRASHARMACSQASQSVNGV